MSKPLWHGRFDQSPADELMAFTESLSFDVRLWSDDLTGSAAHVKGLGHAGILPTDEVQAILAALDDVRNEFAGGTFVFVPSDEDVHTAIERRVTELAGPVGGKLHTGRSRNDQCVTALRLWTKREMKRLASMVLGLCDVLVARAEEAGADANGIVLPGYTHLQRAQPVLLAHHLMAHAWAMLRDVDRLVATVDRLDVSPLGAGALAGSSLPLQPQFTAAELGFAAPFANSLDAVSDRDFVAEALFAMALLSLHLSRMGEEWVLWTSEEFGFATLDDRYATGSSMLPQKKNADIAELTRGKAGRAVGNLVTILTVLKGLPLAYNRDLQEDKEPLFDSFDQVTRAIGAMSGMIATARFNRDAMGAAASHESLAATDVAEWLVEQGTPFREAHAIVGALVQRSIVEGASLRRLVADSPVLGAAAVDAMNAGVANRRSPGAAGPSAMATQQDALRRRMSNLRDLLST
jgi:argininosuccinate lyase